jgi:hypothetical protein
MLGYLLPYLSKAAAFASVVILMPDKLGGNAAGKPATKLLPVDHQPSWPDLVVLGRYCICCETGLGLKRSALAWQRGYRGTMAAGSHQAANPFHR